MMNREKSGPAWDQAGAWGGAPEWEGWGGGGAGLSLAECVWIWVGVVCVYVQCCWAALIYGCVWRTCSKRLSSLPGLFAQLH